tara:strand:+ start:583 stop:1146 length:564 start_codon:yes stop_codon:yes gene_type:complete
MLDDREDETPDEMQGESMVRVLSVIQRRPRGMEIHGLTHPGLFLVRARIMQDDSLSSDAGWIPIEDSRIGPVSTIRKKDISIDNEGDLNLAIVESIKMDESVHLSFFNRAQPISLKMHSYQLLPGIGKSTAQQWVSKRGSMGWNDLHGVTNAIGQDASELLAERYSQEMEDPAQSPRLIDLVVRAGA